MAFQSLSSDRTYRSSRVVLTPRRLDVASDDLRHYLLKKKLSEATESPDKLLAVDALGVVMIKHGEEFGEDSAYGQSLVNFGRAHCTIASLQESFALTFEDTYLATVRQSEDEIKEYQAQRKKLESRRLSYDAAGVKVDKLKNAKKEKELKEREEAEDEYENAKARYEETLEDVRARMWAIQENEVVQLRELTNFLDLEMSYVRSYLEELEKIRSGWIDEETMKKLGAPKARPPSRPAPASRAGSIRSTKSATKSAKKAVGQASDDSSDEESVLSRKKSLSRRKSEAGSKPPSRPQSRASRKRSDSVATAASEKEEKKEKEKEKEKEAKPEKHSHRLSVAGWASSAMSSVTGRGKKDKDKDKFSALRDDDDSDHSDADEFGVPKASAKPHKRKSSVPGLPSTSPKIPIRMLKTASTRSDKEKDNKENSERQQGRKRVVAIHDFAAASNDELSFRVGDQIEVLSEVLDGWWMGELSGKRGLFPTTYTEVINSSSSSLPSKPPLPQRPPSSLSRTLGLGLQNGSGSRNGSSLSSLEDGAHPFGDHHSHDGASGRAYEESIQSSHVSESEDDEEGHLMPVQVDDGFSRYSSATPAPAPPAPIRRGTDSPVSSSPAKKAPPPPPPRRSTLTASPAVTPPALPSRPATLRSKSSQSSSASFSIVANSGVVAAAEELTYSPFDSPTHEVTRFGCGEFKQNPFKPKGFCSNCFQVHSS
ncbi:hypothetical protein C8Q79DRAFT_421652 [Trametes meyenii]|nr:hypothetical protein C8Q79DRAFT_421652 [Trametes meyenii]